MATIDQMGRSTINRGGVGFVSKGKDDTFADNLLELCRQGSPAAYPHDQIEDLVDNFVAYELKAMRRRRRWASLMFWRRLIPWLARRYKRLLATERRLERENAEKEQASGDDHPSVTAPSPVPPG